MSKRKQDEITTTPESKKSKGNEDEETPKGPTFVVTVVNDSIQAMQEWTAEETTLLKQAVYVDGGQFNWETIASCVPSKDMSQVKTYVLSMISQPPENQNNQSASVIKAPIEIWTELAQKLTSDEDKSAAVCVPQLMVAAAAEPVNAPEPGKPNYSQIYLYLSSLLKGETPQTLPPLESSVVLSLIQEIVNKVRTCDLSGQLNFLASSYDSFLTDSETASDRRHNMASKKNAGESLTTGNRVGEKESHTSKEKGQKGSEPANEATCASTLAGSASKWTSSGRLVRQRVQLTNDDEVEQEEGPGDTPNTTACTSPRPRPTSLNPFRIPVKLLNFKPARSRFAHS